MKWPFVFRSTLNKTVSRILQKCVDEKKEIVITYNRILCETNQKHQREIDKLSKDIDKLLPHFATLVITPPKHSDRRYAVVVEFDERPFIGLGMEFDYVNDRVLRQVSSQLEYAFKGRSYAR